MSDAIARGAIMNQQALQPQLADWVLGLTVGNLALGGIILLVLMVEGRQRYAFSATIGAITAIMVEPALKHGLRPALVPYSVFLYLGCGTALSVLAAFLIRAALDYFTQFRDIVRDALAPARWELGPGCAQVGQKDLVKRWFVTIAAATGAVVGSVLSLGAVWQALWTALEPRTLLIALLLVAVSMFLVGPLQAYVFDWSAGAKEKSEPSKKLADVLAAGDWRSVGRLALVISAYVQLYLLTSCVGSAVRQGDSAVLSMIITSAVTPAVVSYYWSAALQRSASSVRAAALEPAVIAGAVMIYGTALLGTLTFALLEFQTTIGKSENQSRGVFLLFSPIIAILAAFLMSAVTTLPFAAAGGYVIDRLPGRPVMLTLGAALLGVAGAEAMVFSAAAWLIGLDLASIGHWWPLLLGTAGWAIGLWASGFPRLVSAGRPSSTSASSSSQ